MVDMASDEMKKNVGVRRLTPTYVLVAISKSSSHTRSVMPANAGIQKMPRIAGFP
jgi:hypothetical protein